MIFDFAMILLILRSALEAFANVRLGPLNLNIPSLIGLALIILTALLLLKNRRVRWHPLATGWAAWLAVLLPFILISYRSFGGPGWMALREWVRLFSIAAVFLLGYNLPPRRSPGKSLRLLFLALPIPLAAVFYQMLFQKGVIVTGQHRVLGTFFHPNSLGIVLVFFIGLSFWRYRTSARPLWIIFIVVEMIVLAATLNIGAFLMLGLLWMWILIGERGPGRGLAPAFLGLFVLMLIANPETAVKMKTVQSIAPAKVAQAVQRGLEVNPKAAPKNWQGLRTNSKAVPGRAPRFYFDSLQWRFANWANLIELWKKRPLLGYGLRTTSFINTWVSQQSNGSAPHNDFLLYLVETGIVGLAAYCGFVLFGAVRMLKSALQARAPGTRLLLWVLTGVFLVWQAGSLGDNLISITAFQFYLWGGWGLALRLAEDEADAAETAALPPRP